MLYISNTSKIFSRNRAIGAYVFLASIFLVSGDVVAENWVEISPNNYYYNSDPTFVDRSTGFVVVETAWVNNDGSYTYGIGAIDCDRWVIHGLATRDANGNYGIYEYWRTDERVINSMPSGSYVDIIARMVCPNKHTLPIESLL